MAKKKTTRQTRLIWSPLASSSPSASTSAFRPATVSFEGASKKRQKILHGQDSGETPFKCREPNGSGADGQVAEVILLDEDDSFAALPTPRRSSQVITATSNDTITPTGSNKRSGIKKTLTASRIKASERQGRLDFSKHQPISREAQQTSNGIATPVSAGGSKRFGSRVDGSDFDSSGSEDNAVASSASKSQPSSTFIRRAQRLAKQNDAPPSSRTRSGRKERATILSSEDEQGASRKATGRRSKAAGARAVDSLGESESSAAEVLQSSPMRKPRRGRKAEQDNFVVISDEEEEPGPTPVRTRKHAKRKLSVQSTSEEDTADYADDRPTKRRRADREEEDLAEDLEFLKSSPPAELSSPLKRKFDARKDALEMLKKKRALRDGGFENKGPNRRLRLVEESDERSEPEDQESEELISEADEAIYLDADDYEEADFIEDDGDAPLGVPDLPLQFSNISRMKGRELFKYVVEWMVQKKLNPAFAMDDEVYDLAFRKVDDEVKGLAGSKFTSAAWTQDFTISLEARPELSLVELAGAERTAGLHHCEACNRKGHPATWRIQFSGKPYDPQTLDEVDNGHDSSDTDSAAASSSDERPQRDSKGRTVPPEARVYHLGQFCMRNAQTAHALDHWRIHLYEFIVDDLRAAGVLDPAHIVERDAWSEKKRRRFANRLVDEMERTGQIKKLYRDFRVEIDAAREAKSAYRGWRG